MAKRKMDMPTGVNLTEEAADKYLASLDDTEMTQFTEGFVRSYAEANSIDQDKARDIVASRLAADYDRRDIISPIPYEDTVNTIYDTFQRLTELSSERDKTIRDYRLMDEDSFISVALDIYAGEITQPSPVHHASVWIQSGSHDIKEELERVMDVLHLEDYIFGIARDVCKYGEDFVAPLYNLDEGVVALRYTDPEDVTVDTDRYLRTIGYTYDPGTSIALKPWDLVHFKNVGFKASVRKGGSVYGHSCLDSSRKVWRQLRLMEDSVSVYRLEMGTRRFLYKIDIGDQDMVDAMKTVRMWERAIKKRSFYNPTTQEFSVRHSPLSQDLCLTGDTRIPLLDGTSASIKELAEQRADHRFEVYSIDPATHKSVVRWAHSPRLVHRDKPVLKITLDNGASVRCTPDHRWMTKQGKLVEAAKLRVGQSMMPFNRRDSSKDEGDFLSGYEMLWDNQGQRWRYTHRVNAPPIPKNMRRKNGTFKSGVVVHHKTYDKRNNKQAELEWMTYEQHTKHHSDNWKQNLLPYTQSKEGRKRASEFMAAYNRSEAHHEACRKSDKLKKSSGKNLTANWKRLWSDPDWVLGYYERLAEGQVGFSSWINTEEGRELMKPVWRLRGVAHAAAYNKTEQSSEMASRTVASQRLYKEILDSYGWAEEDLSYRAFRILFFDDEELNKADKKYMAENFNHKITAIEEDDAEDVYCITVEGTHLFGVEAGIFSENSIFWPVRKESASDVTVLGGDGSIAAMADVEYFKAKLSACLKIPLQYLGGTDYVGTLKGMSLIDIQFARMMKRPQHALVEGLTKLFQTHLRLRRIPFDRNTFSVHMTSVSSLEHQERIEALNQSIEVANLAWDLGERMALPQSTWKVFVLRDILQLPEHAMQKLKVDPTIGSIATDPDKRARMEKVVEEVLQDRRFTLVSKLMLEGEDRPVFIEGNLLPPMRVPKGTYKNGECALVESGLVEMMAASKEDRKEVQDKSEEESERRSEVEP